MSQPTQKNDPPTLRQGSRLLFVISCGNVYTCDIIDVIVIVTVGRFFVCPRSPPQQPRPVSEYCLMSTSITENKTQVLQNIRSIVALITDHIRTRISDDMEHEQNIHTLICIVNKVYPRRTSPSAPLIDILERFFDDLDNDEKFVVLEFAKAEIDNDIQFEEIPF